MASQIGLSQPQYWRTEADEVHDLSLTRLCEMASLLGLDVTLTFHPLGDPIRDTGQQAVGGRFDRLLASVWVVTNETLLPMPGDTRAWDKLLRLPSEPERYLVGVDLESRIRDIQDLVRRTRLRERDGGADDILIVLSDSATNRRLADQLRAALGADYTCSGRAILAALRAGRRLPGSGVILI
jgi:hypothetical protein